VVSCLEEDVQERLHDRCQEKIEQSRNTAVEELEAWKSKSRRRCLEAACCRYSEMVNRYTRDCDDEQVA